MEGQAYGLWLLAGRPWLNFTNPDASASPPHDPAANGHWPDARKRGRSSSLPRVLFSDEYDLGVLGQLHEVGGRDDIFDAIPEIFTLEFQHVVGQTAGPEVGT